MPQFCPGSTEKDVPRGSGGAVHPEDAFGFSGELRVRLPMHSEPFTGLIGPAGVSPMHMERATRG
jgi:hypothetical protein